MSKTYSQAYELGQADGEKGENCLPSRAFVRTLTNIGSYLPGAENRDSEWVRAYKQGFEDKVRTINTAPSKELKMGLESNEGRNNLSNTPAGSSGSSGVDPKNTFAHRIRVAENLYEQMVKLAYFLVQTKDDFEMLMDQHDLLVGEFFDDLRTYHIKPRASQISSLEQEVVNYDLIKLKAIVLKYQQAIHGLVQGQVSATQYFNDINLASSNHLSGLSAAMGNSDSRDYDTQLAVAISIKSVLEALRSQINAAGKELNACAENHDDLMRQDFDAFIRDNIEPRLQSLSNLWIAVNDKDIVGIDDVISRLRTVSSI